MYLLNTLTRQLQEFATPEQVPYAILSHRWTDEEVTFEDIKDLPSCSKKGVSKVYSFCEVALQLGYDWGWVDTCCINKASSAELSEAINSMFSWYRKAAACIVYLQDVPSFQECQPEFDFEPQFRASTWFLRSWTLQELLASAQNLTLYYNTAWQQLGSGRSLADLVSEITTIDKAAILGEKPLSNYCIAERMSWASMRSATRPEDVAYSLLGIFDIQMPLVYGEGLKAFRRLQQAIMSASDDETIFAWEPATSGDTALLARSPSLFASSRYLRRADPRGSSRYTYELMSRGVRFDGAQYIRVDAKVKVLFLNVVRQEKKQGKEQVGIYLRERWDQKGHYRVWMPGEQQLWRGAIERDAKMEKAGQSFYASFDHDEPIVYCPEPVIHHPEPLQPSARALPSKTNGYDLNIVPPAMLQPAPDVVMSGNTWLLNSRTGGPVCNIIFKPPFHGVSVVHLGIDGDQRKPVYAVLSDVDKDRQSHAPPEKPDSLIREMAIDYSGVRSIDRQLLPDRSNDNKDWYLQVWPSASTEDGSWYQPKLWQHPKQQPDLNYFCPFPFDPESEPRRSKRPLTSHTGWGLELLDVGHGKWKVGLAKYLIVSNWGSKVKKTLLSKILTSRPRALIEYTYSIDLDTFKSVKAFPVENAS